MADDALVIAVQSFYGISRIWNLRDTAGVQEIE
jgi:hypothetical protein